SPRPSWCGSLPPAPRRRPPCRPSPSCASSLGWRPWPSPETTNAPAQGGAGREQRTRSVASLVLLRGPPAAAGPSIHRGVDDQRSSVEPCREYVTGFGPLAAGRDNVGWLGLTSPDLCSIGIDRLPNPGQVGRTVETGLRAAGIMDAVADQRHEDQHPDNAGESQRGHAPAEGTTQAEQPQGAYPAGTAPAPHSEAPRTEAGSGSPDSPAGEQATPPAGSNVPAPAPAGPNPAQDPDMQLDPEQLRLF